MKKLCGVLCVVVLLAACGGDSSTEPPPPSGWGAVGTWKAESWAGIDLPDKMTFEDGHWTSTDSLLLEVAPDSSISLTKWESNSDGLVTSTPSSGRFSYTDGHWYLIRAPAGSSISVSITEDEITISDGSVFVR